MAVLLLLKFVIDNVFNKFSFSLEIPIIKFNKNIEIINDLDFIF